MKNIFIFLISFLILLKLESQNYDFNYAMEGRRVCLVESEVDLNTPSVTIKMLDAASNTSDQFTIYRRPLSEGAWTVVAPDLSASTSSWTDTVVNLGEVWEYQIRRKNTWTYNSKSYDAIGYTIGSLAVDNSEYQGQMILLVANDVVTNLSAKFYRLKKELTADGWYVHTIMVNRAENWDSGTDVIDIRNQVQKVFNDAPLNDKPKVLFILGHVPMPRSGLDGYSPDGHYWHMGARGCDAYYADVDGVFTDNDMFNPGDLLNVLQINMPNDYKWDQDFFPSEIEMAFGRVDFADIIDHTASEMKLLENYLDKLSNYKNVVSGYNMGDKSAFHFGYHNSNDGSFRSLPNISKSENVYQNKSDLPHPQWVKNNGPFKIYMQNEFVPEITEWNLYGMDATVFSSDQSSWGFDDLPQEQGYVMSRIRSILASNSKCLVTLWTSSAVNLFHQAGTGMPLGLAMKEVMNHNEKNLKLEKPEQDFDSKEFWNRTLFAFHGDPTLRLFQVAPPRNLEITEIAGDTLLQWNASEDKGILGYNVYKCDSEFGIFNKVNTNVLTDTSLIINHLEDGCWYMVRAIKLEESGCGKFINPSIGTFVLANLNGTNIKNEPEINKTIIYPNPAQDKVFVNLTGKSDINIVNISGKVVYEQFNAQGNIEIKLIFKKGIYLVQVKNNGYSSMYKLIVQ